MYTVNELHIAEPYMLRRDGTLLLCGVMHPYIKYIIQDNNRPQIKNLVEINPEWIMWCKHNTSDATTKQLIIDFINGVVSNSDYFEISTKSFTLFEGWDGVDFNKSNISIFETENLFEQLNNRINNEFCRVRTSNIRWGGDDHSIYFRIGSNDNFDWNSNIYNIVNKYKDFIESISIVSDPQSLGGFYNAKTINDTVICDLPTDRFLDLKI